MQPRARSLSILGLALGLAFATGAARAGTVYVPLPGVTTVGTASWEAEVTIANGSTQPLTVTGLLLAYDTDGTQRGGITPTTHNVGAAQTTVLRPGAAFVGLAEFAGSPSARYAARLAGRSALGQMGVALPVITSANTAPAAARCRFRASPAAPRARPRSCSSTSASSRASAR